MLQHTVWFGEGYLSKEHDNTRDSSYFPDLAPADFYLFPQRKSVLIARRFCDATNIIKNAFEDKKVY
jgi:hypothetical protein